MIISKRNEKEDFSQVWKQASTYLKSIGREDHVFGLEPDRAAIVVVDMQNFVCSPADGRSLPGMEKVMQRTNQLANFCRDRSIPVIHFG